MLGQVKKIIKEQLVQIDFVNNEAILNTVRRDWLVCIWHKQQEVIF